MYTVSSLLLFCSSEQLAPQHHTGHPFPHDRSQAHLFLKYPIKFHHHIAHSRPPFAWRVHAPHDQLQELFHAFDCEAASQSPIDYCVGKSAVVLIALQLYAEKRKNWPKFTWIHIMEKHKQCNEMLVHYLWCLLTFIHSGPLNQLKVDLLRFMTKFEWDKETFLNNLVLWAMPYPVHLVEANVQIGPDSIARQATSSIDCPTVHSGRYNLVQKTVRWPAFQRYHVSMNQHDKLNGQCHIPIRP